MVQESVVIQWRVLLNRNICIHMCVRTFVSKILDNILLMDIETNMHQYMSRLQVYIDIFAGRNLSQMP